MALMDIFGFRSSREEEEEKRKAAEEAAQQAREDAVKENLNNLSNLSKGSQVNFAIPYFDVFDPRFIDQSVPVAIHGTIVYSIDNIDFFHQVNKNEAYSDETFKNKLLGIVTMYVKEFVSNAPTEAQIPVIRLGQKIAQISELVQQQVAPRIEQVFGITVRSLNIVRINIDTDSHNYKVLKAMTADYEQKRTQLQQDMTISNMQQQNQMDMEMNRMQTLDAMRMQMQDQQEQLRLQREMQRMQTVDAMRMQMEDQQERMRLQREGIRQQIKEGRFRPEAMGGMQQIMPGGMQQPMPGGIVPPMPPTPTMRQFHVLVNGQTIGPFDQNALRQMVQYGTLTAQSLVWTQGMAQWAAADTVQDLAALFATPIGTMPPPPPADSGTPTTTDNNNIPAPTL